METLRKKNLIAQACSSQGFTIIELMTVMAIISVITVFAAANYHSGNRQVILDMQASQFAQEVRKTQEWAMAAHQIGGLSQPGYGVYFSPGDSYIIYTDKDGNGFYNPGDNILQTVNLDKNLGIMAVYLDSVSVNGASANFIPPDPTTKIISFGGSPANVARVVFYIKNTSKTREAIINQAGLVYVK